MSSDDHQQMLLIGRKSPNTAKHKQKLEIILDQALERTRATEKKIVT